MIISLIKVDQHLSILKDIKDRHPAGQFYSNSDEWVAVLSKKNQQWEGELYSRDLNLRMSCVGKFTVPLTEEASSHLSITLGLEPLEIRTVFDSLPEKVGKGGIWGIQEGSFSKEG